MLTLDSADRLYRHVKRLRTRQESQTWFPITNVLAHCLHLCYPFSIGCELHQLPRRCSQDTTRWEERDDDTCVISHITQHLSSAKQWAIGLKMAWEERSNDEDNSHRCRKILGVEILHIWNCIDTIDIPVFKLFDLSKLIVRYKQHVAPLLVTIGLDNLRKSSRHITESGLRFMKVKTKRFVSA